MFEQLPQFQLPSPPSDLDVLFPEGVEAIGRRHELQPQANSFTSRHVGGFKVGSSGDETRGEDTVIYVMTALVAVVRSCESFRTLCARQNF